MINILKVSQSFTSMWPDLSLIKLLFSLKLLISANTLTAHRTSVLTFSQQQIIGILGVTITRFLINHARIQGVSVRANLYHYCCQHIFFRRLQNDEFVRIYIERGIQTQVRLWCRKVSWSLMITYSASFGQKRQQPNLTNCSSRQGSEIQCLRACSCIGSCRAAYLTVTGSMIGRRVS